MSRNITEASDHLMRADDEELKTIARHDPDMIRDVAAALSAPRVEAPVPQPTSPSVDGREALEQIIEVANYGAKKLGEIDPAYVPGKVAGHNQNAIERFWLIVRTAKAALSAPRVEPVAWRWRYRRDEELGRWLYNDDHPGSIKGAELEIEPLYTAPPSQPDTVREATTEMLRAGARSIGNTIHTDNHVARAKACWDAMWKAREGILEPVPQALAAHPAPPDTVREALEK